MGREIRKVPANWKHPKKDDGTYQSMYDEFYGDVLSDWINEHNQWQEGTHRDLMANPDLKNEYPFYAMYHGNPPDVDYYQQRKYLPEELTHIQLYQTTSEGTPISPVFKAEEFEQLCEYAADNCTTFGSFKATKEEWMRMLGNGFVHHKEGNFIFI